MNVIVNTTEPGFVENDWVDRTLKIGDEVRLSVAMPDPRCVMTTIAQPGLPQDPSIPKSLVKHNRLDVAGWGLYMRRGVRHGRVPGDDPEGRAGHGGVRPNS